MLVVGFVCADCVVARPLAIVQALAKLKRPLVNRSPDRHSSSRSHIAAHWCHDNASSTSPNGGGIIVTTSRSRQGAHRLPATDFDWTGTIFKRGAALKIVPVQSKSVAG